ncbi:MAG: alpha/beta hydrolase [Clostridia bacterium]|nr:alpha/beta hydrolase [Clostridia bacterium]
MIDERKTLRELLSDPLIEKIAPDAIRNMDLSKDEKWEKSLAQLRQDGFGGDLAAGFDTLFRAAKRGKWYYPLYTEAECEEDAGRKGANLVWLPSQAEDAGSRPYILLVPGGGFVNVWNLTEGWPVAAQFNRLGYNVFVLTYQVAVDDHLLEREMGDFARAIALIRDGADTFNVDWKRYITCGFSAGGYLVCLWNVPEKGFAFHGLPKPQAVFPVYPAVSWKLNRQDWEEEADGEDDGSDFALFGCDIETAIHSPFEIPDHAECFPPCAVFLTKTDELVNPEHSRLLQRALQRHGIPCRLEAGPSSGHGFADGTGMCMAGWIERAVRWYEELSGTAPAAKQI